VSTQDKDRIESYTVLINDEEQYSLWPARKSAPAGWRNVGIQGSKDYCLEYIEKTWTDITPLSVRKRLASARQSQN
jgi:MbtH protein